MDLIFIDGVLRYKFIYPVTTPYIDEYKWPKKEKLYLVNAEI
jgi:hypothetical protein